VGNDIDSRIARLETSCRRYRKTTSLALIAALLALAAPYVRFSGASSTASSPMSLTPSFGRLSVENLTVKWLNVVDGEGQTVVSMNGGAGTGFIHVGSSTPNDHRAMIMAGPDRAEVTVTSQQKPRQFGQLKIMDRKPYLQMYEEGAGGHAENFYQAPVYSDDGKLGAPAAQ
jgi:hypothetical protein